jgi:hypothetical protein
MLPAQLLSVLHRPLCMPSSYPPFSPTRRTGHPRCGGFCSLMAESPDTPTLRFPERTGVALRSDLAHDSHQNSNLLFRLR